MHAWTNFRMIAAPIGLGLILGVSTLSAHAQSRPSEPDSDTWSTYQSLRINAGREAAAHTELALWCERNGLEPEARKHLALALVIDPDDSVARGLLGQVRGDEGWVRPEDMVHRERSDPHRLALWAEYEGRRSRAEATADDQQRLAFWCEQNGLETQADAHWTAVTRLDPSRDLAWKRLGYKKQRDGRWMTNAQIEAAQIEAEAQKTANARWVPLLTGAMRALNSNDPDRRAAAEQMLAQIDDPRAVPAVWRVFARQDEPGRLRAVQVLGQIDARPASRALAALAVFGPEPDTRRAAAETLVGHDPREFADLLIPLLQKPIRYNVLPVAGPGSTGVLKIEGEKADVQRFYQTPSVWMPLLPGDSLGVDPYGLPVIRRFAGVQTTGAMVPFREAHAWLDGQIQSTQDLRNNIEAGLTSVGVQNAVASGAADQMTSATLSERVQARANLPTPGQVGPRGQRNGALFVGRRNFTVAEIPVGQMMLEAQRAAQVSQQQLESDIEAIETRNQQIDDLNQRVRVVLASTTGQDLGVDPQEWVNWYRDQLGMTALPPSPGASQRPTVNQPVAPAYVPQIPPVVFQTFGTPYSEVRWFSCFGAGTPVHTRLGLKPIEDVGIGDEVLTQDPSTGELTYRPVVKKQNNPPSQTLRVKAGGETIVTSVFHRFWKAHEGWAMARELRPDVSLRGLGTRVTVDGVETGAVEPVYNLEVDGTHTFFVGRTPLLVHDLSVPDFRARPFDAGLAPELDGEAD